MSPLSFYDAFWSFSDQKWAPPCNWKRYSKNGGTGKFLYLSVKQALIPTQPRLIQIEECLHSKRDDVFLIAKSCWCWWSVALNRFDFFSFLFTIDCERANRK